MPQFLSDDWFAEIDKIIDDMGGVEVPDAMKDVKINLEVKDTPNGTLETCIASGRFVQGFADDAPTKLKLSYDLARKLFIERDQNAGMQAFMSGQIQIEGDMTVMMKMQGAGGPTESQKKLEEAILAMTDG